MGKKIVGIIILLALSLSCFVGCSAVVKTAGYFEKCMNDPECKEEVLLVGSTSADAATKAASGIPFAPVVGGVIGSVIAYVYGVMEGKKSKEIK